MDLDPAQAAAREQFAKQSRRYGKTHLLADTADVAAALESLGAGEGRRALDIATGGGHTALYLARNGWDVIASDLTPEMTDRAAELAASEGVAVRTAVHSAESLPYPDATFHLVTCRVAAHHFSNPAEFVSEVARVLHPSGHFLLIDGTVPDGDEATAEWLHAVEKLRDPSHGRFLQPSTWRTLCANAGLHVLSETLTPLKQPDIEWYFETAATSPENRAAVWELVASVPESVRASLHIAIEDGKLVWWWPRLSLLAVKPGQAAGT